MSLSQYTVSAKHSNKFESTSLVRKVRIICSDPYATDSSEDEGIFTKNGKRFVHEILLPVSSCLVSNASVTEGSIQGSNNGWKTTRKKRVLAYRGKKSLSSRKYKGIRPRKRGKWAAEICDPVKHKRIWLGACRSAEALMAYKTKRIEFEASANSTGCGEEKISCSLVLSNCANYENHNLCDVGASVNFSLSTVLRALHFSPSVAASDSYTLVLGTIAMENDVTRKANVVEKGFTELEQMDEELMALTQAGKELDLELELDSIMIDDGDDFMMPMDYLANGFEDLPICGLFNEDQTGVLPDFDLNFDFKDYSEAFSWMDEAPTLMNGVSPLNIACP